MQCSNYKQRECQKKATPKYFIHNLHLELSESHSFIFDFKTDRHTEFLFLIEFRIKKNKVSLWIFPWKALFTEEIIIIVIIIIIIIIIIFTYGNEVINLNELENPMS